VDLWILLNIFPLLLIHLDTTPLNLPRILLSTKVRPAKLTLLNLPRILLFTKVRQAKLTLLLLTSIRHRCLPSPPLVTDPNHCLNHQFRWLRGG